MSTVGALRGRLLTAAGIGALCLTALSTGPVAAASTSGGWTSLGHGATPISEAFNDKVETFTSVGSKLYVGGDFTNAGGVAAADHIGTWDGSAWHALGGGLGDAPSAVYGSQNASAASFRVFQPDAEIKTPTSAYAGAGIYTSDGTGERRGQTVARGATGTFTIRIGQDGLLTDSVIVSGCASPPGSVVSYKAGASDITSFVVAGTYATVPLASGATVTITMSIKVKGGTAVGTRIRCLVQTHSHTAPGVIDAVKARVTAS